MLWGTFVVLCILIEIILFLMSDRKLEMVFSILFEALMIAVIWNLIIVNAFPREDLTSLSIWGCIGWSVGIGGFFSGCKLLRSMFID